MAHSRDIECALSTPSKVEMTVSDVEKATESSSDNGKVDIAVADSRPVTGYKRCWAKAQALMSGLEVRGASPVPLEERTVTQYSNAFSVWFCSSISLLPLTFGILGPLSFGLSLRDSFLLIFFATLLVTIAPAYLATLGPRTGMRQMIQARFTFGRYLVSIPVLLNLATLTGFNVILAVVGGQTLSAVSGGRMSADVGIAIIAILAMLVCFCGFGVLHAYERYAWIPALVAMLITIGCGGKHLQEQAVVEQPAPASSFVSFFGLIASFMLPWAPLASDFTTYISPQAPPWKIGLYTYLGLTIPSILLMTLGAAIGGAVLNVASWNDGYDTLGVGGIVNAMLTPAGGFGKFVAVLLSFTVLGNLAATTYSISLNFQMLVPWLAKVPRQAFSIVITAIVIPVSIRAAVSFFDSLQNLMSLIGYWSGAFVGIVLTEHFVFRRGDCESYDHGAWNTASKLPSGYAALGAAVLSFGLVIPGMAQVWYVGPIAEKTGDIGLELALAMGPLLYMPLRAVEKSITGR